MFLVVAVRWSDEKKAPTKEVVGIFDLYYMAEIFKNAYNEKFSANAEIVETDNIK